MLRRASGLFAATFLVLAAGATSLNAQFSINARAGVGVPTGSVADSDNDVLGFGAESGFAFGFGFGFGLGERAELRANFDRTMHSTADGAGTAGPDIDVNHYIVGLGYRITNPESPFYVSVNLGAGALNFSPDVTDAESETNFAINAGAEIGYWLGESIAIFASPQGDIAFTDEDVFGTSTAFVWPFTGGVKIKLGS